MTDSEFNFLASLGSLLIGIVAGFIAGYRTHKAPCAELGGCCGKWTAATGPDDTASFGPPPTKVTGNGM